MMSYHPGLTTFGFYIFYVPVKHHVTFWAKMTLKIQKEFYARLCPHRGDGCENTLDALLNGLASQPFILEFDVQFYDKALHLGHPPHLNKKHSLSHALKLFDKSDTLPKVDVKLKASSIYQSTVRLADELNQFKQPVLVNLSSTKPFKKLIQPEQYLKAERYICKNTYKHVMLNIDLDRYKGCDKEIASLHLASIQHRIFSISPNLDRDIELVKKVAIEYGIKHIHFWAHSYRKYRIEDLTRRMEDLLNEGFEVYFDLNLSNISHKPNIALLSRAAVV